MDVASWLIDLGLGEYADAFADNDVDDATLPRLNRTHIDEHIWGPPIGVTSL